MSDPWLDELRPFQSFYDTAVLHRGGVEAVESQLPAVASNAELIATNDAQYLSQISRRIFRAGLRHAMVDAKWPAFEEVFAGFKPRAVAMMSDEALEALTHDERIIRHFGKIKAVRHNAMWVLDIVTEHGSFGQWLADWPSDQIVSLWAQIKKGGTQLGGQSAARFLRMVGKDTFLLTDDVVAVLKAEGVVDKMPTSQRDLKKVQAAFNVWQRQSGRSLAEISRILSFTTNVS